MVTSICGSSSRGVISTATTPSNRPSSARIGVSGLDWKAAARRPEMPKRCAAMRVIHGRLRSALRCAANACSAATGSAAMRLAACQPGQHFDLVAKALAEPQLAQRNADCLRSTYTRADFAALHDGADAEAAATLAAASDGEQHLGGGAGLRRIVECPAATTRTPTLCVAGSAAGNTMTLGRIHAHGRRRATRAALLAARIASASDCGTCTSMRKRAGRIHATSAAGPGATLSPGSTRRALTMPAKGARTTV